MEGEFTKGVLAMVAKHSKPEVASRLAHGPQQVGHHAFAVTELEREGVKRAALHCHSPVHPSVRLTQGQQMRRLHRRKSSKLESGYCLYVYLIHRSWLIWAA